MTETRTTVKKTLKTTSLYVLKRICAKAMTMLTVN